MPVGDSAVVAVREIVTELIRGDGPLLSSHQLAVYLTCYVEDRAHTVRGLAADLRVSKSVITRALDRLSELDLARRSPDPADRRSILIERTERGRALLAQMERRAESAAPGVPH
ncbi:MAG: MarR family transcriptional regulator [Acetobacteraceae bacterium]|nr:MarR family transcriptional regulator [Acetobacteraceae bacterium]